MFRKHFSIVAGSVIATVFLSCACQLETPGGKPAGENGTNLSDFTGRWSLYLPGGAGWLEVRQEEGYMDGDVLWYGGSVIPVSSMFLRGDTLFFTRSREIVRERDQSGKPVRIHTVTNWMNAVLDQGQLKGRAYYTGWGGQKLNFCTFTGEKIPPLPPAPDLSRVEYGKPVTLFNGKDLTGWELVDPSLLNGFKVENGVLVNDPEQGEGEDHVVCGNLRTVREFKDFNLKIDVNVPEGSNSGIYLRGIYEVQVTDSYGKPLDSHNMGAIYSRITPEVSAGKPAGQWQSMDITFCDRHVTVVLNGTTIIDNQPLLGVTGGAISADEFSPGPLFLQGDHGPVSYRNIVLTPITSK